jgi:hypothetical protein
MVKQSADLTEDHLSRYRHEYEYYFFWDNPSFLHLNLISLIWLWCCLLQQVTVARPAVENDNKRGREEVKTRRSDVSRDKPDYSHGRYGHDSLHRQTKAPRLSNMVWVINSRHMISLYFPFQIH